MKKITDYFPTKRTALGLVGALCLLNPSFGFAKTQIQASWESSGGTSHSTQENPGFSLTLDADQEVTLTGASADELVLFLIDEAGVVTTFNAVDDGEKYDINEKVELTAGVYNLVVGTKTSGVNGVFAISADVGLLTSLADETAQAQTINKNKYSATAYNTDDIGTGDPAVVPDLVLMPEYTQLKDINRDVQSYGFSLLGDSIDLNSGSVSFEHTDISIPGNFPLEVAIRRSRSGGFPFPHKDQAAATLFEDNNLAYPAKSQAFSDWQLEVPRISKLYATQQAAIGSGQLALPVGMDACAINYSGPLRAYFGSPDFNIDDPIITYQQYANGMNMTIPGIGSKKLLDTPSGINWPADTVKVTPDYWHAKCIDLTNGEPGGLLVTSPSGDKYYFDTLVLKPATAYPTQVWVRGEYAKSSYNSWFESVHARVEHTLLASKVEDAKGNWVQYNYDAQGWLLGISSSDDRSIVVNYDDTSGLVENIKANGRTWTYQYEEHNSSTFLKHVTLPDSRKWTFDTKTYLEANSTYNCENPDETWQITHPSGTHGVFTFTETVHKKTRGASAIEPGMSDTCSPWDGSVPEAKNYYDAMSLASKTLTLDTAETFNWSYSYSENTDGDDKWTSVVEPDSTRIKHTFYHGGDTTLEGLPKSVETRNASNQVVETITYTHLVEPSIGKSWLLNQNEATMTRPRHQRTRTITRYHASGQSTYTLTKSYESNQSNAGYSYGLPIGQTATHGSNSKTHKLTYLHDTANWALGQLKTVQVEQGSSFVTEYEMTYASVNNNNEGTTYTLQMPHEEKRFGEWKKRFAEYHPDGNVKKVEFNQLKKKADGTNDTTLLNVELTGYYRGSPTTTTVPARFGASTMSSSVGIDSNGWVTSQTDLNGVTTSFKYDAVGRLKSVNLPNDATYGNNWLDTFYTWNDAANTRTVTRCVLNSSGTACSGDVKFTTTEKYDSLWRLKKLTNTDNVNNLTRVQEYRYDKNNQKQFESVPSATAGQLKGTSYTYDALGQLKTVSAPGQGTVAYQYQSGNKMQVTDGRGNITVTTYLAYGQPSFEQATKIESPENVTTDLAINLFGNITSITQSGKDNNNGDVSLTEYRAYDSQQRLCKVNRADVGQTVYSYNSLNQMTMQAQGTGGGSNTDCTNNSTAANQVTFTYDNLGSVSKITYPGTGGFTREYSYDNNGNVTYLKSGDVVQTYKYNNLNLLEEETLSGAGFGAKVLNYGYSELGHRAALTYPNGDKVEYAPNGFGEPTQAVRAGQNYATVAKYHPTGALDTFTYGNGVTHKTTLNSTSFLPQSIVDKKGSTEVLNYAYTYDNNSNVTSIKVNGANDDPNSISSLVYDKLDRLTSTVGGSNIGNSTISYDGLGNILTYTSKGRDLSYNYNRTTNRLTSVDTTDVTDFRIFNYDSKGNVTNNGFLPLAYNDANQMITAGVSGQANAKSYLYDGYNRRVRHINNERTKYSFYSQDGTLIYSEEEGVSDENDKGINYIYLGKKLIAKDGVIPENSGKQHYRPFGESIEGAIDGIGYTGHKYDADLGLSYMQARYYDPVIGRFYSNDPVDALAHLGTPNGIHGFNRYAYANNNPYKYTDPDGKSSLALCGLGPGGCAVGVGIKVGALIGAAYTAYKAKDTLDTISQMNESAESEVDDIVKDLDDKSEPDSHKGKTKKAKVRNLNSGESVDEAFDNFPGEANDNGVKTAADGSTAHVHTSNSGGEKTLTIKRPNETKQRKYRENQDN